MKKVELYKFRSLANKKDFCHAKDILENNCFWCSNFLDLNDPMEGIFYSSKENISVIYTGKNKYKICSFSDKKAFENPIMWGYYANGFKGIAIKIMVDGSKVKEIEYYKVIPGFEGLVNDNKIKKILTAKLELWDHEEEFRFLIKAEKDKNRHEIGKVVGVYFGDPYGDVENGPEIAKDSKSLCDYYDRKAALKDIAKTKSIKVHTVKIEDGKVKVV